MSVPGPWKRVIEQRDLNRETEINKGVNGPVITYFMDLEEVHERYGKPGDTQGYVSPPLTGTSRKGER